MKVIQSKIFEKLWNLSVAKYGNLQIVTLMCRKSFMYRSTYYSKRWGGGGVRLSWPLIQICYCCGNTIHDASISFAFLTSPKLPQVFV